MFHDNTTCDEYGWLWTTGGRVLTLAGRGSSLELAVARAYAGIKQVKFEGMEFRGDIASRYVFGKHLNLS